MFDLLCFPPPGRTVSIADPRLRQPLPVPPGDEARFVCAGHARHLGRVRACGWHLVLHRAGGDVPWTHLYRVLVERGGARLVLLCRAAHGDRREAWTVTLRAASAAGAEAGACSSPLP